MHTQPTNIPTTDSPTTNSPTKVRYNQVTLPITSLSQLYCTLTCFLSFIIYRVLRMLLLIWYVLLLPILLYCTTILGFINSHPLPTCSKCIPSPRINPSRIVRLRFVIIKLQHPCPNCIVSNLFLLLCFLESHY